MEKNHVIAIDGFSSCGKSTLAKQLAQHLKFAYVDSGAMYRAVTLHFIKNNIDIADLAAVKNSIDTANIEFRNIENNNSIFLNNENISEEIRKMHVSEKVSKVSPIKVVRNALVKQQQKMGETQNIIMDGRDIGTHVFPNATVKLFMTADPNKRAERRHSELIAKQEQVTFDEIFANLKQRDHDDTNRLESPLVCAIDATVIDNTTLTMHEQFDIALDIIESKISSAKIHKFT